MKIIFTAMLLTGCLVLSTARAEMLYQFKFEGADDAARLKSTGTQKCFGTQNPVLVKHCRYMICANR